MTESSIVTPAMLRGVGFAGEPRTVAIERGAIVRFAAAIGDPNPAYPDVAPPTFLRSVGLAVPPLPDAESVPRVLDGASEWTYEAPVRPGDTITFSTVLDSLKEREGRMGAMLIVDYRTEYVNQRGELAATQHNTVIRMRPTA
jgi:acyl dehydratase